MSDSLVLTGSRQVTKHKGTEMVRTDAKRGGNTWMLPRWWVKGNGTVYVDCTVFAVTAGGATGYLAIESSPSVNIRIDHDGAFNFEFYQINEATRAALYDGSMELVEHYVFPRMSGGKTMVVTPADGATRPGGTPPAAPATFTGITLAGASSASDGDTETYTSTVAGTATDVVSVLSSSEAGDVVAGLQVTFNGTGARTLTLAGTSAEVGNSQTDNLSVTIS